MNTLSRFAKYYRPYKSIFFIDLLCATIISIIDLAYPQILRSAVESIYRISNSKILSYLLPIAVVLFIVYLIQCACRYYVTYKGHIMGAQMERDMRQELFEHYEKLSFSYYDQNNSGTMMSRLVSDLFDIGEFAHHGPENLFISLIKIIGSFTFLFIVNWMLAVPLLILVCIMFVFSISQNKRMQATFMENRRKIGDINASLQDTLSGIRVVQSFANEDIEREKFSKSNHRFLVSKKNNYKAMAKFMTGNLFFQSMMYLTTLIFGGYLISKGLMTPLDLTIYALYIGIFVSPIQILVELIEMMQKGLSGFNRFTEILDTTPDIEDIPNAIDLTDVKGDITFDNVSFNYEGNDNVINNVSFKIKAGSSIAFVGPSGGGKTTLCSLLPRFYDVTEGSIKIDDKDIRDLKLKSLRNNIGIVQQDVYMFYGTILENLSYGKPSASFDEIVEAAKKANIHDFIMSLPEQYNTFVGEKGTKLSGGQKQRISIARVFLKNPPILILDEATSALDNDSEQHIQNSLYQLSKGRTTITIAHRLSTIRMADEILVIADEGIKERGNHEKLLAQNGLYAYYYNMQFNENV